MTKLHGNSTMENPAAEIEFCENSVSKKASAAKAFGHSLCTSFLHLTEPYIAVCTRKVLLINRSWSFLLNCPRTNRIAHDSCQ